MNRAEREFRMMGRVDRLELMYQCEHDRAQELHEAWAELVTALALSAGLPVNQDMQAWGPVAGTDLRRYTFECWGEVSALVAKHLSPEQWGRLHRIDWQVETDIDESKLIGCAAFMERNKKRARTVSFWDSQEREKSGGRFPGGKTAAIGSHKGNSRRLAAYKRKKSKLGKIELQLRGDAARSLLKKAQQNAQDRHSDVYQEMIPLLQMGMMDMARGAGYESLYAMAQSLRPDAPEVPDEYRVEMPEHLITSTFADLPPDSKLRVLAELLQLAQGA